MKTKTKTKTKMKTKMKTKLVVSICALTLIFSACKKDAINPEPVLDCNGIENGVAVIDSCGDCQQAYIYNYVSHEVILLDDTSNITLEGTTMLVMPEDAGNVYWNSGCITSVVFDCNGIENGVAVIDSCGVCHQSYIYNFQTHIANYINDTTGLVLDPSTEMLILAGSANDIASNPNWNDCK